MNLPYLVLIVLTLAIGLGAQAVIRHAYAKWSKVPATSNLTGAQVARQMLDANGLHQVSVQAVAGELSDHYDPRSNVVSLSQDVYSSRSVSAAAIACHECGHAVQHAQGYAPARVRGALVPTVSLASNAWIIVLFAGIFLNMMGLVYAAIGLYLAVIVFQVVTLPVEFNASARALAYIQNTGYAPAEQLAGAKSVLRSAALTYVAAALTSLLQLLWLLGHTRSQ